MTVEEVRAFVGGPDMPSWNSWRIDVTTYKGETFRGRGLMLVERDEHGEIDPPVFMLDQPEEELIRPIPVDDIAVIERVAS